MNRSPEKPDLTRALEFAFEPDEQPHALIGPYKLLEKIGEGGFGVVWMAEQQEPVRRRVALKIIKTGMDTRELIARFEAERQALAMMDHPNIARVFDAGATETGRPYFVMELVRGVPITQFCDEDRVSTEQRLRLWIDVCHAVQHAHQKGIIHRDLKPSNVLITLHDDKPVAKVIDFGIAKAIGGAQLTDKTLFTRFHTFMGTPAYTSPEQIGMNGLDIDTRSDIYSLGVLLYVLLTGRPPFDAEQLNSAGLDGARRTICEVDPPRPSQSLRTLDAATRDTVARQRGTDAAQLSLVLRGDLDWVVMRCLEKDRARRYESAAALAADVERYLAHEPIIARPPSAAYTMQKLVRRHRVAFASAGAIAAVLVIGAVVSTWQAIRATRAEHEQTRLRENETALRREAQRAQTAESNLRVEAEANELTARRQAYVSDMNVIQQALSDGNLLRARTLLYRHRPKAGETDLRGWEWRYLWQRCQPDEHRVLAKREASFTSLAASPDGRWLAAAPFPTLWNLENNTRQEIALPNCESTSHVAFSPRAPLLAIAAYRRAGNRVSVLVLWNIETRQIVGEWVFNVAGDYCTGLFFSNDGQTIATSTGSAKNEIRLWRVSTGELLRNLQTGPTIGDPRYGYFAATADLQRAAYISSRDFHIHVLDLITGRDLWSARAGSQLTKALAFSPDGKILASGQGFQMAPVRLWDTETGTELASLEGHRLGITQLAFFAEGRFLASCGADQTVRIWDVASRQLVRTLRGHTNEVHSVTLVPGKPTLVSGSKDGELAIWDIEATDARAVVAMPANVRAWRFTRDGLGVVILGADGRVTERRGRTFGDEKTLFQLPLEEGAKIWPDYNIVVRMSQGLRFQTGSAILAQNSPRLAYVTPRRSIEIWDWERGVRLNEIPGGPSSWRFAPISFAAKGEKLIASRFKEDEVTREEWDVASGQLMRVWKPPTNPAYHTEFAVVLAPDEKRFFATAGTGTLVRTDLDDNRLTALKLDLRNAPTLGSFSPDGSLFAIPTWNGITHVVGVEPLRHITTLSGFQLATDSTAFSADSRRLAIGSGGEEAVTLWDVGTYDRLITLAADGSQFRQTAFSPDGSVVGSVGEIGGKRVLYLWRAPTGAEIAAAEKWPGESVK
jgi:eukaryotic-like serine/threonine-protein kinase